MKEEKKMRESKSNNEIRDIACDVVAFTVASYREPE
jgi:hypothetical protein